MNKPRKAKSRRLDPLPLDASETKCGICLDVVVKRAKIGPCSHLYCFTCLLAWSRLNNTCPQCKLTFRCISRVDFLTNRLEEKVFIKDKTIKKADSSDEDYPVLDSEEIEDSDPDFIDNTDIPSPYSDDESEALFTQKRRCIRAPSSARVRKGRVFTDSESEDESARCQQSIMDKLDQSPDLFGANGEATPPRKTLSRINCPFNSARGTENKTQISRAERSPLTSKTNNGNMRSPRPSTSSVYFTSPKYNKGSRWAQLDTNARRIKRKRGNKTATRKPALAITTISSSGNNTGKWLSTLNTSPYFSKNKENQTPTKSAVNAAFKLPFKKTTSFSAQKTSGKLYEDPEDYFARIIAEDE